LKSYEITITGKTPLLMNADNIEWADRMARWKDDPMNRKGSKAGDDRSPAFRWLGTLYHDGEHLAIPSDNLMRCLMEGGAMVPVPGGRSGKTFKAQTQSGCMVGEPFWKLSVRGKSVPIAPLMSMTTESNFDRHQEAAAARGFQLFLKRAKIGTSKHIRVRPRFDQWSATGTLNVWDEQLTLEVLTQIFTYAGQYKGLGDWRPGGKTPGPHGMFSAVVADA